MGLELLILITSQHKAPRFQDNINSQLYNVTDAAIVLHVLILLFRLGTIHILQDAVLHFALMSGMFYIVVIAVIVIHSLPRKSHIHRCME